MQFRISLKVSNTLRVGKLTSKHYSTEATVTDRSKSMPNQFLICQELVTSLRTMLQLRTIWASVTFKTNSMTTPFKGLRRPFNWTGIKPPTTTIRPWLFITMNSMKSHLLNTIKPYLWILMTHVHCSTEETLT